VSGFAHTLGALLATRGEVASIVALTLLVSGIAIAIAMALGVPLGIFLGLRRFPLRNLVVTLVNTGMGLPPVVVGLVVFLLLARSGPFGRFELLYTPWAMVIAQVIIATPLVVGVTLAAIQGIDPRVHAQILSLGASRWQYGWKLVQEARLSLVAALAAGFGSIISEVGAVMLVGGNIEGKTRVLTTAIVLDTRTGEFSLAIALGIILLALAFLANAAMLRLQGRMND
jgi:tungstate transport system permease protein